MPSKTRVLIVEDDPSFREALLRLLIRLGHEARAVSTAREAIGALAEWAPQRVILDLVLPDDNGVTVLRAIRQRNLPIKVAITTGLPHTDESPELKELSPDVVLTKPLDLFTLAGWLASVAEE